MLSHLTSVNPGIPSLLFYDHIHNFVPISATTTSPSPSAEDWCQEQELYHWTTFLTPTSPSLRHLLLNTLYSPLAGNLFFYFTENPEATGRQTEMSRFSFFHYYKWTLWFFSWQSIFPLLCWQMTWLWPFSLYLSYITISFYTELLP